MAFNIEKPRRIDAKSLTELFSSRLSLPLSSNKSLQSNKHATPPHNPSRHPERLQCPRFPLTLSLSLGSFSWFWQQRPAAHTARRVAPESLLDVRCCTARTHTHMYAGVCQGSAARNNCPLIRNHRGASGSEGLPKVLRSAERERVRGRRERASALDFPHTSHRPRAAIQFGGRTRARCFFICKM